MKRIIFILFFLLPTILLANLNGIWKLQDRTNFRCLFKFHDNSLGGIMISERTDTNTYYIQIYQMDNNDNKWHLKANSASELSSYDFYNFNNIVVDKDNNIWMMFTKALIKFDWTKWQEMNPPLSEEGLIKMYNNALSCDSLNDIYVKTSDGYTDGNIIHGKWASIWKITGNDFTLIRRSYTDWDCVIDSTWLGDVVFISTGPDNDKWLYGGGISYENGFHKLSSTGEWSDIVYQTQAYQGIKRQVDVLKMQFIKGKNYIFYDKPGGTDYAPELCDYSEAGGWTFHGLDEGLNFQLMNADFYNRISWGFRDFCMENENRMWFGANMGMACVHDGITELIFPTHVLAGLLTPEDTANGVDDLVYNTLYDEPTKTMYFLTGYGVVTYNEPTVVEDNPVITGNEVTIYPNPVTQDEKINLSFKTDLFIQINDITITDITGRIICRQNDFNSYNRSNNTITFNPNAGEGVYFIRIRTPFSTISKPIIIIN